MTTLPSRNQLTAIGQTYGQVRTALGDLRDFLGESLGTSGGNPLINNATIANALGVGVRTSTPGADMQINGSLSLTKTPAASMNPGSGNMLLEGKAVFPSNNGTKLEFNAPSGNPLGIGQQPDILYYRTKQSGSHVFYSGGVHSDTAFAPGTGGAELLRLSESDFKYKGQTIYHSGNGVFIRKDAADTAQERITFSKGLEATDIVSPVFRTNSGGLGTKLFLIQNEAVSLGVQGSTLFARTPNHFVVYRGGSFVDANVPAPGANGETLLHVSTNDFRYKGQNIYHTGNVNFVEKTSNARPGVTKLYRVDAEDGAYIQTYWDGSRMFLEGIGSNGGSIAVRVSNSDTATNAFNHAQTGLPLISQSSGQRPGITRVYTENVDEHRFVVPNWDGGRYRWISSTGNEVVVNRSDSSAYADRAASCSISDSTNYIHGQNIADGTVRYWELSRGQGTVSGVQTFDVHQYTFGSPVVNAGILTTIVAPTHGGRRWRFTDYQSAAAPSYSCTWDYITGSGDPYTWVIYDDMDNIIGGWDAEDPAYRDFPDLCPILDPSAPIPDYFLDAKVHPKAVLVSLPSLDELAQVVETFESGAKIPKWVRKSKFKDRKPRQLFKALLKDYVRGRHVMDKYEEEMSWKEFIEDLDGDDQKKNWRKQAMMRQLSRMSQDTAHIANLPQLLRNTYKVNPRTGKLTLK